MRILKFCLLFVVFPVSYNINTILIKMSNWADLPFDIVSEIMRRLSFFDDIIIVSAVCKSWQSSIHSLEKYPLPPSSPWLMLAEESEQGNDKESETTRSFFNLLDTKVYDFNLPEIVGRKCFGTSLGWLVSIGIDLQIKLFHPLSKHQISLPPQPTFFYQPHCELDPKYLRDMFVSKFVLSRSPWNSLTHEYDGDCVIVASYEESNKLAFTRPGYKAWIDIESSWCRCFVDIAFYKGKFYVVEHRGEVSVCCIDNNEKARIETIAAAPKEIINLAQLYLVESSGDLLLVQRIRGGFLYSCFEDEFEKQDMINDNQYVTIGFTVLKLKRCTEAGSKYKYNWVKADNLGDQALFVGDNKSVSLSASSFNGCKANCIYFTDDSLFDYDVTINGGGYDMGIFSMEDGTIKDHYPGQSLSYFSTPLWYI